MIDEKKLKREDLCDICRSADCSNCFNDDDFEEWIARQPQIGEWIPCSERLPETEDKVMCCTETKKGNKNIVIGYYMDGAWRCGMNSNVIAWQPLPEPMRLER